MTTDELADAASLYPEDYDRKLIDQSSRPRRHCSSKFRIVDTGEARVRAPASDSIQTRKVCCHRSFGNNSLSRCRASVTGAILIFDGITGQSSGARLRMSGSSGPIS